MNMKWISLLLIGSVVGLTACSEEDQTQAEKSSKSTTATRWYSKEQVFHGNRLYQANCASCHQADASGTKDWRKIDANGNYPPPPLNGTAHAWHHPLSVLRKTVEVGGVPLGGTMPGFSDKLNQQEIDAILAWVQSHWSDEIYRAWFSRNEKSKR